MTGRYDARPGIAGRIIAARLKPGSDLLKTLRDIVSEEGVEAGVILSGVGLLGEVQLRNCKSLPQEFPIIDSNRAFLSFRKPLEILSLSGNISKAEFILLWVLVLVYLLVKEVINSLKLLNLF